MLLVHSFLRYVYAFWVVTKTDVINSNVHRSKDNFVMSGRSDFALEQAFLKPMNPSCFSMPS